MSQQPNITIAVDGYSSCGKSTVAKQLALYFKYIYVDTGAMYRSVSLYFLRNNIDINYAEEIAEALEQINIDFRFVNDQQIVHLNGEPVEKYIRKADINAIVSDVAKISAVRKKLVKLQRTMGKGESIVMDGRDIGTVVFPNANLKFFITSDIDVRVQRRFDELQSKNIDSTKSEIKENLQMRDFIDSTREDSPLRKADDAILIDNTNLTKDEQLNKLINIVKSFIQA